MRNNHVTGDMTYAFSSRWGLPTSKYTKIYIYMYELALDSVACEYVGQIWSLHSVSHR